MSSKKPTRKITDNNLRLYKSEARRFMLVEVTAQDMREFLEVYELVTAPESPTDEDINATIARAQGWTWLEADEKYPGTYPAHWRKGNGEAVMRTDYSPVSRLDQALEAAAALSHLFGSRGAGMHAVEAVVLGKLSSAEASRNLAKWMHDRIKEGNA